MENNAELIMRLNKLSEIIAEKEAELENIREIGTRQAGVDDGYVRNLRNKHLTYQREYNAILEEQPSLANHYPKIIIDTFKDHWLDEKEYQILEPVEINLQKRMTETSWFHLKAKIGETELYEIYAIEGSFIRLEKRTNSAVYLGEGNVPKYSKSTDIGVQDDDRIAAAVYKNWVYWYESNGIMSDKFIYRRSLDGQLTEKLDWLSNEKTMEVAGHSAHYVSEDIVFRMFLESGSLVIEAFRKTQKATYRIIVSEDGNNLNTEYVYPWETKPIKEPSKENTFEPQSNKRDVTFIETDLSKNPFYVLEVAPTDKRSAIIDKAEEKAFFLDSNACDEAQTNLLNPAKRLSAEMDWFCGCDGETISCIRTNIDACTTITTDKLTGLARLNATLFNFAISNYDDYFELGYAILDIDEQYSTIDVENLADTINDCHAKAGILQISKDEISRELNKKREQIRRLITEKTQELSENDYIELVTMIAEKCIVDDFYEDGIILSDVIDQYEVKMQSTIDEANEKILSHIEKIKTLANDEGIEANLTGLISRVQKWDVLVQPLQLNSQASGVVHRDSRNIGGEIRDLSLWLHNEKGLSELALKLVQAMKPVFAELTDLADMFESDSDALTNIINGNKEAEKAVAEMNSIKAFAEGLKSYATSIQIDEFINKVKAANRRIKNISLDEELISQIRENICYIAREVAITLHNEKQETDYALRIATMLVNEFGDLPEIKSKLTEDVSTLNQQALLKNRIKLQQEAREREEKTKNIGCLVVIGIVLLIWIISSLSQCDSSTSSTSSSYSSSSSSSSSSYSGATTPSYSSDDEKLPEVAEPMSGAILSGHEYSNGSEITITASGSSSCVVKLKTSSGTTRLSFYVRAGDTVTVGVPAEYLYVYFASGEKWYGTTHLFGERTSYSKDDKLCDFTQYTWEYTLRPVTNGNFSQTIIDEDDFK